MELGQLEQSMQNRRAFDNWKVVGALPRVMAFLIDSTLVAILMLAFVVLLNPDMELGSLVFIWVLGMWAWEGMWLTTTGTSPGKRIFGVSIYSPRQDGVPNPLQVCVRILSFWTSFGLAGMGLTPILFRRDRRGWHDLISETLTVGKEKSLPSPHAQSFGQALLMFQALLVFSFGGALLLSTGTGQLKVTTTSSNSATCDNKDLAINQSPETLFAIAISPAWQSCVPRILAALGPMGDSQLARVITLSSRYFEMWNQELNRRSEYYQQAIQPLEEEICTGNRNYEEVCRTARHMASVSVPNIDTKTQVSWLNQYEQVVRSISLESDPKKRIVNILEAIENSHNHIVKSALKDRLWVEELALGHRPTYSRPRSYNEDWNNHQSCWLEALGYDDTVGCRTSDLRDAVAAVFLMLENADSDEAKDKISRLELGENAEEFRLLITAFELTQTGRREEMQTLLTALRVTSPLQGIARSIASNTAKK